MKEICLHMIALISTRFLTTDQLWNKLVRMQKRNEKKQLIKFSKWLKKQDEPNT
jgi:hypothetical protein